MAPFSAVIPDKRRAAARRSGIPARAACARRC